MYAFVLIHFGDKITYLEYELYFLLNLRENTKYDICYLYSIHDTPKKFVNTIKKLNVKTIGYDDTAVTYNIPFESGYEHFNTLRTCNFMYALQLTQYHKICILESDMVILKNIDSIFNCKSPSVFYSMNRNNMMKNNTNYELTIDQNKSLLNCKKGSPINGGVIVIEPSLKTFDLLKKNIKKVIKNQCSYPNETLLISTISPLYNVPIQYNFSHYRFRNIQKFGDISILHYNQTIYKPLKVIQNKYNVKDKIKSKFIQIYKKNVYEKYKEKVNILLKNNF